MDRPTSGWARGSGGGALASSGMASAAVGGPGRQGPRGQGRGRSCMWPLLWEAWLPVGVWGRQPPGPWAAALTAPWGGPLGGHGSESFPVHGLPLPGGCDAEPLDALEGVVCPAERATRAAWSASPRSPRGGLGRAGRSAARDVSQLAVPGRLLGAGVRVLRRAAGWRAETGGLGLGSGGGVLAPTVTEGFDEARRPRACQEGPGLEALEGLARSGVPAVWGNVPRPVGI